MKTIFLTSAYEADPEYSKGPQWLKSSSHSATKVRIVDNPAEAECILFVESHPPYDPYFSKVHSHPIYLRYPQKTVLYHDADLAVTRLKTLSPSIENWQFQKGVTASAHYIARLCENKSVENARELTRPRQYLYSFTGSSETHSIRKRILNFRHPNGLVRDTKNLRAWLLKPEDRAAYEKSYVEEVLDSEFILCPRGIGPSTYRQFEAMQLGRVPVIISDEWVPIRGIEWSKCSIRIPESKVDQIPEILKERSSESYQMGCNARLIWEEKFSKEVSLEVLADLAFGLVEKKFTMWNTMVSFSQFRSPYHARGVLRAYYKKQMG